MELIRGVRPMTGQDIEQVADLEQVCFSESWSENLIRMGLDSRLDTYFVYADHGAILGLGYIPITGVRELRGNLWMPWWLLPGPEGSGPLPWRSGKATWEPENCMIPMVSGRRLSGRDITTILPRMPSSCGIGQYERITT